MKVKDFEILIIGAGPAGLTAAWEAEKHGVKTLILESDKEIGGISRTVERNGWRFDIGGHRFFTKVDEVYKIWDEILDKEDFLEKLSDFDIANFDLIIVLDCGSIERTGIKEKLLTCNNNQKIIEDKYGLENKEKIIDFIKNKICNKYDENLSQISFQCEKNLTPIYFDHKVADSFSVFQKLIYYGSYPTTGKCEFIPLIKGEHLKTNSEQQKKESHCVEIIKHMEEEYKYGEDKLGSKTFYKNIDYFIRKYYNIILYNVYTTYYRSYKYKK